MSTPTQAAKKYLLDWFGYPNHKVYCQVSTTLNGHPHIRTMDLYHITETGNLILITETRSRKWNDLKKCPKIAICIACLDRGQIIIEGTTTLNTGQNAPQLSQLYWNTYLNPYWRDFYLSRVKKQAQSTTQIPDSFGIVAVTPNFWEILEINSSDFLRSSRKQFHLKNNHWIESKTSPI